MLNAARPEMFPGLPISLKVPRLFHDQIAKIGHVDNVKHRTDMDTLGRRPGQMLPVQGHERRILIKNALDLLQDLGACLWVGQGLGFERQPIHF
jgi:hypothetical protein